MTGTDRARHVLVLSPHFPPTNTADMQRVRIGLPYLAEFGWRATVLAVDAREVEAPLDPLLLDTLPPDVPVHRVGAIPVARARSVGVGALALRAMGTLLGAGAGLLQRGDVDLVFISTTAFPLMALGRVWKQRFGVPFVLDMQDPWLSGYHEERPDVPRLPKYRLARLLHGTLEPWTMARVDGLMAVSADYITTLLERYPRIAGVPAAVLPFGANALDFALLDRHPQANPFFRRGDGTLHGVYVGRGGPDMARALRIVFGALRAGLASGAPGFGRLRLHFIGTDYAPAERARRTVLPVAGEMGVAERVEEHPVRVPYFQGLQALRDADFLVVPGSDDPQYTASKLYPYILSRRPMLAVFHERSGVVETMRRTRAGEIITFGAGADGDAVAALRQQWVSLLSRLPFEPPTDWSQFEPFTAREMTRRQCALFDRVLDLNA